MRARPPVLTLLAAATAIAVAAAMSTSAFAAAPTASTAPLTSAAVAAAPIVQHPVTRACSTLATAHTMRCFALRRTDIAGVSANALSPNATPAGFGPADLDSAYKLSSSGGVGQTIAIVDAFNDPTAVNDLAVYRSQFGLPVCNATNSCFRQYNQNAQPMPLPPNDAGWAGEESLDIDMASAICPLCRIILVEANSASDADLYKAEDAAVALGAKFVSNSWGGGETSSQTSDDAHFNHTGVAITVSSGDDGTGPEYPATSRYVTAVGGTSLRTATSTRGWSETAWADAGSGCSAFDAKPTWQTVSTGSCTRRAEADVSAVADPNTGVAVYQTFGASGWVVYGGTSVSSPIMASVYALAGTPAAGTYPASYPYAHTANLFDVTSGSNGSCGAPICTAGTGWDGPTGLGTPNGTAAFANGTSGPSPLALNNPGNQTTATGSSVSLTLTATGGTAPYSFSATGLPTGLTINASTGVISGTPSAGTFSVVATVHDAASGTATASFTWTVSTSTCTVSQLLGNPGFETGSAPPWTSTASVVNPNGARETSHTGTWYAWLDGYATVHGDTLSQSVTVPATCTTVTFSYWLHIDTSETTTTAQFDKLTVAMINGTTTTTLATFSNLDKVTGYALHTSTLTGTAGHTITIKFTGTEDSSLQTSFVVDDAAVNVS